MRQIGFLQNYEVCDTEGETQHADIFFVTETREENKMGTVGMTVFKVGEHNEHESKFHDIETDAWYEAVELIPEPQLPAMAVPISVAIGVFHDAIRGLFGSCEIPSIPYMGNDENQMSDRDRLEVEYFDAVVAQAMVERVARTCTGVDQKHQR